MSPSGRYSATKVIVSSSLGDTLNVVVRGRSGTVVAVIDPNPGGTVRTLANDVRFVGGDNILVSWGCGTYCRSAPLFSPTGETLADLGIHEISSNGRWAITYPAFDAPMPGDIVIVDLATGEELVRQHSAFAWNSCDSHWSGRTVTLVPCSSQTDDITVRF